MCEFISWIETKGRIYFLSDVEMDSRRGQELKIHNEDCGDWTGHGAIAWFYGLSNRGCEHRECGIFYSPDNFPPEIVKAIKTGKMTGFDSTPSGLLSALAWAEYDRLCDPALAKYNKICDRARAECTRLKNAALDKHDRICDSALAKRNKIYDRAWSEYENRCNWASEECDRIRDAAWNAYRPIWNSTRTEAENVEQNKLRNTIFWALFAKPENRPINWR